MRLTIMILTVASLIGGLGPMLAQAQHSGDMWLAVSSTGQLKLSALGFQPDFTGEAVVRLNPASGLLDGWTGNNPGFDDIETADPQNDDYPLADGANVWLEIIAIDPALIVWAPGLTQYFNEPGQQIEIGSAPGDIHMHLTWHINSNDPQFDVYCVHWRLTCRLTDAGSTTYSPSEAFTLVFSNVDCMLGEFTGDELVNAYDIDGFIAAVADPLAAPDEVRCAADANMDGFVNAYDIDWFIALVAGG
ncbi:MAG: hypothetical protein ABIG44_04400 [Planctomycetota bacterium]